ncbi:TetR family transcriptional regulator [Tsukamurella pseudospumae]|uniref:HTH tetR-type domain-containing protein n=1 Tax=Tsukamurella pseudospumae TaxID=239498 RepID=A0A137ZSY6_9ACTN|nr:TetR family transcriptional regulator [Tsukamurella pseudospumae]KXP01293.1 hypothetical protein AXK61_00265 [Tsukamurella pseudospumae]
MRKTSGEINDDIVDVAAGVFARHGFRQATVQEIAAAAGYSKAAVLKRFSSKYALQEAALAAAARDVGELHDALRGMPRGAARDRAGIEYLVDLSARRPGVVALALSAVSVTNDAEVTKHLHVPVVDRIFAAFGAEATDLPRVLRLTAAFGALAVTTLALGHLPVHETRGEVIAICCATLATPTTPS